MGIVMDLKPELDPVAVTEFLLVVGWVAVVAGGMAGSWVASTAGAFWLTAVGTAYLIGLISQTRKAEATAEVADSGRAFQMSLHGVPEQMRDENWAGGIER